MNTNYSLSYGENHGDMIENIQLVDSLHDNVSAMSDSEYNKYTMDSDYLTIFRQTGFLNAFIASLSVIIVSELGDKTFFIAAILAMKNSRLVVFVASMLALGIMTVLASVMGIATTIVPRIYIHYTSIILFFMFGLKMLKEGFEMSADEAKDELNSVQSAIEKKDQNDSNYANGFRSYSTEDPETGVIKALPEVSLKTKIKRKFLVFVSLAFIETFTMIFLAEWGDRSQISTLVLAARENVIAVTLGALLGHFLCTGLAVIGGRFIAQMISVKTAFDRLSQLFCSSCYKTQPEGSKSQSFGAYIKDYGSSSEGSAYGKVVTDTTSTSIQETNAGKLSNSIEKLVAITPFTRDESNSSSKGQQSSQNFMKILEKIEASDEDGKELAAEREKQRRRRLAEEQRLLSKPVSTSSGAIEANSSDETASQTLIGLPSDAVPKDPGKIQLGLIVAHEPTSRDSETQN